MTQGRLLRYVGIASVSSLLLPLVVGLSSGGNGKTANRLAEYLQIPAVRSSVRAPQVKANDDSGVPESSLPGQSVGGKKATSGDAKDTAASDTQATSSKPTAEAKAGNTQKSTSTPKTAAQVAQPLKLGDAKKASDYTVKAGDTYGCIAEKYYGSYEQYSTVMVANWADTTPGYGEYHLDVGAKVRLPAVSGDQLKPITHVCS